jgi:L-fuculose-phosphate aldolase
MNFQSIRGEVLATCRTLADRGFLAGTGGNIALRVDSEHFAVTPSGTDYYAMTAADICVVRTADRQQVWGDLTPSVESGMHGRVLVARPDCNASVHTHQPIASAYSLFGKPLQVPPEFHELLGKVVPCAGYAPSGTAWLAGKVAKIVRGDVRACLMRNHGVICVGADTATAIRRVEALESACAQFFADRARHHQTQLPSKVVEAVMSAVG